MNNYGGPSWSKEKCHYCDVEIEVYRGGSWDINPKACLDCKAAKADAEQYRKTGRTVCEQLLEDYPELKELGGSDE